MSPTKNLPENIAKLMQVVKEQDIRIAELEEANKNVLNDNYNLVKLLLDSQKKYSTLSENYLELEGLLQESEQRVTALCDDLYKTKTYLELSQDELKIRLGTEVALQERQNRVQELLQSNTDLQIRIVELEDACAVFTETSVKLNKKNALFLQSNDNLTHRLVDSEREVEKLMILLKKNAK